MFGVSDELTSAELRRARANLRRAIERLAADAAEPTLPEPLRRRARAALEALGRLERELPKEDADEPDARAEDGIRGT